MKNPFQLLCLGLFFSTVAFSQFDCQNGRFSYEIFNSTITSDVTYGSAYNVNGQTQSLELDIYQPQGDTAAVRPLLIMAHGGSFIGGSKTGTDVVFICQKFAKMGYVVASIEYRLGFGQLERETFLKWWSLRMLFLFDFVVAVVVILFVAVVAEEKKKKNRLVAFENALTRLGFQLHLYYYYY